MATAAELAAKEAKKKARMAAKNVPPPKASLSSLAELPLFEGAPKKLVDEILAKAEAVTLTRDQMLSEPGARSVAASYVQFIVAGQVGIGEHTEEASKAKGAAAKKEIFKKVGRTLAVMAKGDFWSDDIAKAGAGLCLYAITECQVIRVPAADLGRILKQSTAVSEKLRKHAEKWMTRLRFMREEGGRDEIFDFYVKNGFSFSTRTKIRQLELCIDCDKCVVGCEERHGLARLERFGPQVGLINFSVSCRQCYDPRCLIDCNFDAIARDPASHEIRINMQNCTGCGVCARNCPNDSIFVYDVNEGMDTSLWEQAGKKAPKKVATKCDRCAGYDDMACITACPTGSMIDAVPELIFGLATQKTIDESCSTRPFEEGWSEVATPRALPKILYGLAAALIVACIGEWVFRRWLPGFSFMPVYPDELSMGAGARFDSGRGLGLVFGIVGAVSMLGTLIYVLRNRFEKEFSSIGGKYLWFSIHNALGVLGPALVFLHGNLLFTKWPSVGVWAMLFVVVSGLLGQYLANQIPGRQFKNTRERQDLDKSMQNLSSGWGEHTRSINLAELMMKAQAERAPKDVEGLGTIRFLAYLIQDDLARAAALRKLRTGPLGNVKNDSLKKQVYDLTKQRMILERQDRVFKTVGRLMSQWKLFHIFFSVGLFLLMMLHVAVVTVF